MTSERVRHIEPTDPGGEPLCLLTAEAARERRVPIDRLLELGALEPVANGYELRLPPGDEYWELANTFAEEEARCCPALMLEIAETQTSVTVTATF